MRSSAYGPERTACRNRCLPGKGIAFARADRQKELHILPEYAMIKPYFFYGQISNSSDPGNQIRFVLISFFRAVAQKINNTGGDT